MYSQHSDIWNIVENQFLRCADIRMIVLNQVWISTKGQNTNALALHHNAVVDEWEYFWSNLIDSCKQNCNVMNHNNLEILMALLQKLLLGALTTNWRQLSGYSFFSEGYPHMKVKMTMNVSKNKSNRCGYDEIMHGNRWYWEHPVEHQQLLSI